MFIDGGIPMAQATQTEYGFSQKQITLGLIAIFAVYGSMAYFVQTLNIARPKIAADLNGMSLYSLAVSIPSLVSAFVTLVFGKLSDIYGRRIMLLVSVIFCLIGTILGAISPNFIFLIIAGVISALGTGAMMPLTFAVVGDLFPPERRGKWIGMLRIPTGILSLFGPTLGGWFVDNLSWRYLYWMAVPLLIACVLVIPMGVPTIVNQGVKRKIDLLGCVLVAIASSTLIIGFSFAGTKYPWGSPQVIGLLLVSIVFWVIFLRTEDHVEEPILDPLVLRNRSFLTVAIATLFSFFGMMYFPMFLQGVQSISTTRSGQIITPYSVLMAFIGVPVGFCLGRSGKFKWMYVLGFGILTVDMFGIILFTEQTPIFWSLVVVAVAGIGLGAVPTVNTMVVQNAVPKRLLGVAMGAIFFAILMGVAIAPALLGSAMNASYAKTLNHSLPQELHRLADRETIASLGNPRVLLSQPAMDALKGKFDQSRSEMRALFPDTVHAIRHSMQAGVNSVFWISAITMLIAFLIICTIPAKTTSEEQENEVSPARSQS
jgi:MFS family permease